MKTYNNTLPRSLYITYLVISTSDWFESLEDILAQSWKSFRQFPMAFLGIGYLFISMSFCYWPIFQHWLAGFMMMTLPVAIVLGAISTLYLYIKKQRLLATIGLVWCLMTIPLAKRMMGAGNTSPEIEGNTLKVLSFNSAKFSDFPSDFGQWSDLQADIACFQEYSPNHNIEQNYTEKAVLLATDLDEPVGLGLLSKYPIHKQYGRIWDREGGPNINGFIVADIVYNNDTVRVVNAHLWSMGIRINQAFDALKQGEIKTFFHEMSDTFSRLKHGFEERNRQIEEVQEFVTGSRYPVIICGDFNETPFGYAYGKMSLSFRNAFEESGEGMGFTLNRQPYCVRIDQQFYSNEWKVQSCKTVSSVSFSDHFPLMAHYQLNKPVKIKSGELLAGRL
ncbi:endonuclease/exonuclease/phosphatase family protein [Flectobacillus major]|uniref:endonuclease/exonuclease/phosphatase family protein n=1 Tax=Flectobacillus major TaxID=103 RepID=UPI0003F52753|nr:endonuclease/exonuclease/phosphatase family protein [Flectobacillus major]